MLVIICSHRIFTAAILLVVELIFLQQLVAAILQSALAPVLVPERCASHRLFRQATCPFYLFQTLPAAGSQRRREVADAEFLCLLSRPGQSECEAQLTASSALRLSFQSAYILSPSVMIVVAVNPTQPQTLRMALAFLLTDLILLTRKDIWIVIKNSRLQFMIHHPLDNRRRTWCTAGVQQHPTLFPFQKPIRQNDCWSLHLGGKVTKKWVIPKR